MAFPPAAQKLPDRRVVHLTSEIPERHVNGADVGAGGVAQTALDIVVHPLAGKRIAAEKIAGDVFGHGAAEAFAGDANTGVDAYHALRHRQRRALLVNLVKTVVVSAHVFDLMGEVNVFDLGDFGIGHRGLFLSGKGNQQKGFGI